MLLCSKYVYNNFYTTFSNILLKIGNTEVGLWLPAIFESPHFGMGVTLTNFKQSGKIPVRIDKLIKWHKTWETWRLILSNQKLRMYWYYLIHIWEVSSSHWLLNFVKHFSQILCLFQLYALKCFAAMNNFISCDESDEMQYELMHSLFTAKPLK